MLEAKIQAEIVRFLSEKRKDGNLEFFCVPNEAASNPVRQGQMIAMGLRPGVSDLVVLLTGSRVLFLEVKNETGVQRESQKKFQSTVQNLGFEYFIVRSTEDVKKILQARQ